MVDKRIVILSPNVVLLKRKRERIFVYSILIFRYIGRKLKKRDMRKLWIMRINVGDSFVLFTNRPLLVYLELHIEMLLIRKRSQIFSSIEKCLPN